MTFFARIFSCLFLFISNSTLHASDLSYIKEVNSELESHLVKAGEELLQALSQGKSVDQIRVLPLLLIKDKKKSLFSKAKALDPSLLFKKSKAVAGGDEKRREELAKIVALMWKIRAVGKERGEDAVSASYKLIDPGNKVYAFLKSYVNLAKTHASSFAYERDPKKGKSSHYIKESPESQFGIDIRFQANQSSLPLLPYKKVHLLFGKLKMKESPRNDLLFVKFESQGIASPIETVKHGVNYLKTLLKTSKEKLSGRIEKVIRPEVIQAYLALTDKLSSLEKSIVQPDQASTVAQILEISKKIMTLNPAFKATAEKVYEAVQSLYPHDGSYSGIRTGNEIIIDLGTLR